jgi:hypothetical protein
MAVKITVDNVDKLVKAVKELTGTRVVVGIPAKAATRPDGPVTNALIGYINEMGSPEQNIPPRPHLVPGVRDASPLCVKALQQAGEGAMEGNKAKVRAGFDKAVSSVRNTIAAVIPPPLAPRTLSARQRRGHAGETPLIDTGEYKNAITYEVRGKK